MIDTNSFKSRLEADLVRLVAELETIALYEEASDDWIAKPEIEDMNVTDDNVEADAVEEWNERRATVASLEIDYRNIKRALEKIAKGTFGICEISQEEIDIRRLEINPTARTCSLHMNEESTLSL